MQYLADQAVSIPVGTRLRLTQAQASAREHAVRREGSDSPWFVTSAPVQFKRGESVFLDGAADPKTIPGLELVDSGPEVAPPVEPQSLPPAEPAPPSKNKPKPVKKT